MKHLPLFLIIFSCTYSNQSCFIKIIRQSDESSHIIFDASVLELLNNKVNDSRLETLSSYSQVHNWYTTIPAYGLAYKKDIFTNQGKGIRVGCLDTGIGLIDHASEYHIHPALFKNSIFDAYMSPCILDIVRRIFYEIDFPVVIHNGRYRFLEDTVCSIIQEYIDFQSDSILIKFLRVYGSNKIFKDSRRQEFSSYGYNLIKDVKHVVSSLTCGRVNNTLKSADRLVHSRISFSHPWALNHGTGVAGIIAGSDFYYEGIAPQAQVLMAPIFDEKGKSTIHSFIEGLLYMIRNKVNVVCMSLSIPDDALTCDIKSIVTSLIHLIPYTIGSTGNNKYTQDTISFPANICTFSIGSYGYDSKSGLLYIPSYSQYQHNVGPVWLMPGENICMPCTLMKEGNSGIHHCYHISQGTSFAAAFATGLIALFLAQVDPLFFNHSEIMTILSSSNRWLEKTPDWKMKSILGTLDICKALFIVLVLHAVKKESPTIRTWCEAYFKQCVDIMHFLLSDSTIDESFFDETIIVYYKNILCSVFAKTLQDTMLSSNEQEVCYRIVHTCDTAAWRSQRYIYPKSIDYEILTRIYGTYEAERIKEYVESYITYYW